ncbi:MAG: hypothetical protein R2764_04740 [Bacteroidales bacterium]
MVENKDYEAKMKTLALGATEFFKVTTADGVEMDGYMIKPPISTLQKNTRYCLTFMVNPGDKQLLIVGEAYGIIFLLNRDI